MKQSILITGGAGTGKTTVSGTLTGLGLESYDIEGVPGLFTIVDNQTGGVVSVADHDNLSIDQVKRIDWVCDIERLQALIARQKSALAFYCGAATNINALPSLFTRTILLRADPDVLRERLATRDTSDLGRDPLVREWVMQRTLTLVEEFVDIYHPTVVHTDGEASQTVRDIIAAIS